MLSAQYFIDSAIGYSNSTEGIAVPGSFGCAGGSPIIAMSIAKETLGVPTNSCRGSLFNNSAAGSLACMGNDTCSRCSCVSSTVAGQAQPQAQAVDYATAATTVLAVGGVPSAYFFGLPVVFGFAPQSNLALTVQTQIGSTTILDVANLPQSSSPTLLSAPYSGFLGIGMANPMDNFFTLTGSYSCFPGTADVTPTPCTFSTTCDNGTAISSNSSIKVTSVHQIDKTTLGAISTLQASATPPVDTTDPSYVGAISQIKTLVQTYGPVTVGFREPFSFMNYRGGVYSYTGWVPYAVDSAPGKPVTCTASTASTACAISANSGPNVYKIYTELSNIGGSPLPTNCVGSTSWQPVTGTAAGICAMQDVFVGGHAVSIVGWGTDSTSNQNYWIVANNWGSNWGEGGFVKMAMNGMTGAQIFWYDFVAAAQF